MMLVKKEVDRDLVIVKKGKEIKVKPKHLIPPFMGEVFDGVVKGFDKEFKDSTLSQIATQLFSQYSIYIYPEEYPYSNYRENRYKLAKPEKETEFIDIEEKISLSDCIKEYLGNRNIEYVKNDKNELKNMVNYLKNVKSFSFRKMEKELGIGREKLRMLLK